MFKLLEDLLQETLIMEMAFRRKQIKDDVNALRDQIIEHLCKVILLPLSIDYNHWITELNAWLRRINRMKIKGAAHRKLNPEDYYEILFDGPLGAGVHEFIDIVEDLKKEGYPIPSMDFGVITQAYEKIEQIIHTISYDISSDKFDNISNYVQ